MYSDKELLKFMHIINWDTTIPNQELVNLLKAKEPSPYEKFRKNLYIKIINSFNWHEAKIMIPEDQLKQALADEIIQALFPRNLREKYKYVRALL